jgi:hypothetical protein
MKEEKKLSMLSSKSNLFSENQKKGYKDGVEIEKGIILNETYLEENLKNIGDIFSIFTAYPDIFLDLITPETETVNLFFYQRIFLRAAMRF